MPSGSEDGRERLLDSGFERHLANRRGIKGGHGVTDLPLLHPERVDYAVRTLTAVSASVFGRDDLANFLIRESKLAIRAQGMCTRLLAESDEQMLDLGRLSLIRVFETRVSVGNYEAPNLAPEQGHVATQSIEGIGCRPTRPWIFNRLSELFPHVYLPKTQPAHEHFPTDWTVSPSASTTRAVFVASRSPLDSPSLVDHLIDKQTHQ